MKILYFGMQNQREPSSTIRHPSLAGSTINRSIAGGISAAIAKTVFAPLERVRIIRQAADRGRSSSPNLLRSIYAQDGIRGLWRGNAVNLSRIVPSYAIRFTVFGNLSDYGTTVPLLSNPFVAGSLSGLASSLASYPLEVIRTRLSISGSLREAVGKRSLFAGCSLTVLETMPYAGLSLGTYSYLSKAYPATDLRVKIMHGFAAGGISTIICFPLDTLRRNKMVRPHDTVPALCRSLYSEGGVGRYYRGLSVALTKSAPTVALTMIFNDMLLQQLGSNHIS